MKKIDNLTTIILFAVFLLTLGIGGWMLRDQSFSENENRYLQQKPQISAASIDVYKRQCIYCIYTVKRQRRPNFGYHYQ